MIHWKLSRLVAYVAVLVAVGLLFLAGASVSALMWPRPVVPFGQMGRLESIFEFLLVKSPRSPGDLVFEHACRMGLEGIVSKHWAPLIAPAPSDWLKFKSPNAPSGEAEAEEE